MKQLSLVFTLFSFLLFIGCSEDPANSGGGDGSASLPIVYPETIDTISYVAIGASDAVGVGATPETNGYVYLIADDLQNFVKSVGFHNLGVSGYLVTDMVNWLLDSAIALEPNLITIWTGGNDFEEIASGYMTIPEFNDDLETLFLTLTDSLPEAKIVIGNLPNLMMLPRFDGASAGEKQLGAILINSMNDIIEEQAETYGASVADLMSKTSVISDDDNISDDGFHPSNGGYQVMAEVFMREIVKLF
jgi:lysophospholipase L1-like esterase